MEVAVTVVTFRDIFQYEAGKRGRYSDLYRETSALILLDRQDMARLAVKDGQSVKVENEVGSIVVAARASEDDPHPGLAFMTNSPWSNQLVRDDVCETSIPGFKRIEAKVSPTKDAITQVAQILQRLRA